MPPNHHHQPHPKLLHSLSSSSSSSSTSLSSADSRIGRNPSLSPLQSLTAVDYSYLGTYMFLCGCLVFSFHSFCVVVEDSASFLNWVYLVGTSLFTIGSVFYAVDAEKRTAEKARDLQSKQQQNHQALLNTTDISRKEEDSED